MRAIDTRRTTGGSARTQGCTVARRRPPDAFELEILRNVVGWAQYGGLRDEETLPLFGMSASATYDRACAIICTATGATQVQVRKHLLAMANRLVNDPVGRTQGRTGQ